MLLGKSDIQQEPQKVKSFSPLSQALMHTNTHLTINHYLLTAFLWNFTSEVTHYVENREEMRGWDSFGMGRFQTEMSNHTQNYWFTENIVAYTQCSSINLYLYVHNHQEHMIWYLSASAYE